jgi:hypothetical protein
VARPAVTVNKWKDHPVRKDYRWDDLREALGSLNQEGAHQWAVIETETLLGLEIAKRAAKTRAQDGTLEEAAAFVNLLRETVSSFEHEPQGRLLTVILALSDPWTDPEGGEHTLTGTTLTARRELAGRYFKFPHRKKGVDSIRLNHEPTALDRLAVNLMREEVRVSRYWSTEGREAPRRDFGQVLIYFSRERVPESGTYSACGPKGHFLGRTAECAEGQPVPGLDPHSEFGWALPGDASDNGSRAR